MAEFSGFWTTNAAGSGHQVASYTQAHWSDAADIIGSVRSNNGIAAGYLNSLAGTVTGPNTVSIDTGGAVVDGKWYKNDSAKVINIPSAVGGGNTRIDRIVLRADWSDFKVEITRIAGTDAANPVSPAITQNSGTIYDIPLYRAVVNTSGTVTLIDERQFGQVPENGIADNAVSTLKIAPGAVTTLRLADGALAASTVGRAKMADGFVNSSKIADGHVIESKIADGAVTSAKIATGAVTTAKIANDAVDDTKAGDRVPQFYRRQGGSATDWSVPGETSRTPGAVRMQAGKLRFSIPNGAIGATKILTFPVAFSNKPLMWLTIHELSEAEPVILMARSVTASGAIIDAYRANQDSSREFELDVAWLAIGPE